MKVFIGVDVGGTTTKFGIFSNQLEMIQKWSIKTRLSEQGNYIVPDIAAQITEVLKEKNIKASEIQGIGIGIPGPVDEDGYVSKCVNLHWNKFHVINEMKRYFKECLVVAENDANIAALGEYFKGKGKGYNSLMLVTLGTGVGGGIIINGKIWSGCHSLAGEIGHIMVREGENEFCNCGGRGCIDQYASATGIEREMRHLLSTGKITDYPETKAICEAAKTGDELARRCLRRCMEALGKGLACVSHILDPEIYLIGGGVSKAGGIIVDYIQSGYKRYMYLGGKETKIDIAGLGNDAGITGAACLAAQKKRGTYEKKSDL